MNDDILIQIHLKSPNSQPTRDELALLESLLPELLTAMLTFGGSDDD